MSSIEMIFIFNVFIAFAVAYIVSQTAANSRRLKGIESLLARQFGNGVGAVDQDIVQLAKDGDTTRATIVYRERHDVSLREAELAIERIKASQD